MSHNCSSSLPPGLPDPEEDEDSVASEMIAVNRVVNYSYTTMTRKRPLGQYTRYDPSKIAKYAFIHNTKATAVKFTQDMGKPVAQSTVRSFKKHFLEEMENGKDPDSILELPYGKRGKPLLLPPVLDDKVQVYLHKLCIAGGVVNRTIVIAVGHGIANYHDSSLLIENGGTLEITRKWAESLMKRMNLVKRKGTQAARKVPLDFKEIKLAYLDRISSVVNMHKIPSYLVINWDQTGCKFVPTSNWTMEEKGVSKLQ